MGPGSVPVRLRAGCLICATLTIFFLICPVGGRGEEPPGDDRVGARSDDWITINKDYSSQRYVDLDRITPRNVDDLKEVCELQLNEPNMFNSGLLKVGRTLYINTANQTVAFDAASCNVRWRYLNPFALGHNSRGSAYLDGKIFRGTADGRLIALGAKTGEPVPTWPDGGVQVANPQAGESLVAAPIAWQGKVFIGIIVSDVGIAGRLMAFDADTGKELWRFNTTLGANSGGGTWSTYSLDPATGEVFSPVANPYPDFNRDITPGDKDFTRYTNSVISLDATTGRLNWYYQVVPMDEHDWDMSTAPTLYRTSKGKDGRDMLALAGKSGRAYGIDRTTQLLAFNTPATTLENDEVPLDQDWKLVCPGIQGGAQFNGAAYHQGTGLLYVGMNDHCAWYIKGTSYGSKEIGGIGGWFVKDWSTAAKLQAPKGWITAIDGNSGQVRWQYEAEAQVQAGLVPTKSGLLFGGDTHGNLLIFNAKNGKLLRSIDTGGALNSGLISYSVGDEQYIAAAAGGATENPSTAAGPLRVIIYGLRGPAEPKVVALDRLNLPAVPGETKGQSLYQDNCSQCHGRFGEGVSAPPITRQSQLADRELLKHFLKVDVLVPMPHLYPGVLEDKDVELIAEYLGTKIFNCGPNAPQSCALPAKPTSGGTQAWRAVYSVLTSPRCINCHPVSSPYLPHYPPTTDNSGFEQDYPRQGDDRHPHYYGVLRGEIFAFPTAEGTDTVYPGMGPPFERCISCHGNHNDPVTGIPGTFDPLHPGPDPANPAPFWALAPAKMAWESTPGVPFTGPQLCAQLKDKERNGNRKLADTLHHLETEPLILWSFNPGTRPNGEARTTPPISHDALIQAFTRWIAEGAPCPSS
jgi:alcohol dehydrogenase (cytochrome c)